MATVESNAWIPKTEGDTLEGKVIGVTRAWSDSRTNGGKDMDRGWYPLLTIEADDGAERALHAFTAILESRVLDLQPLPGERIKITYLGVSDKEPPKGKNAPKLYRFEVPNRDPSDEAKNTYAALGATARPHTPPAESELPWGTDGTDS